MRIEELTPGMGVTVSYESPEDDEEGDREEIFIVSEVRQVSEEEGEHGGARVGDWIAHLKPPIKTKLEDHLRPSNVRMGDARVFVIESSLSEIFGMTVVEVAEADGNFEKGDQFFVWGPGIPVQVSMEIVEKEEEEA